MTASSLISSATSFASPDIFFFKCIQIPSNLRLQPHSEDWFVEKTLSNGVHYWRRNKIVGVIGESKAKYTIKRILIESKRKDGLSKHLVGDLQLCVVFISELQVYSR